MSIGLTVVLLTAPAISSKRSHSSFRCLFTRSICFFCDLAMICPLTFIEFSSNSNSQHSRPRAVATKDLNGDGILDLVIANSNTDSIGVSFGFGDGRFSKPQIYSTGYLSSPYSVAIDDINGDQQFDIAVANFRTHTISIFLGLGNGNLTLDKTLSTGIARPLMIVLGHLNKDRFMDLVVVHFGTQNIGVYLTQIDGNYSSPIIYSTGDDSIPYSIDLADLNNDSFLDIVVANLGTSTIIVFFNHGNGRFFKQTLYSTGFNGRPNCLTIADIDHDTYSDLIIANVQNGTIVIWFGNENGTFERVNQVETNTDGQSFIVVHDFNQDSLLDIAISSTWMNQISILLGFGNGSFMTSRRYFTGYSSLPFALVAGDFNQDDRQDLVVVNNGANNIGVFLGYDSGVFQLYQEYETGPESNPKSIVLADFNEDGIIDIVVGNTQTNTIGVYLSKTDGFYLNQTIYSTGLDSSLSYVTQADVNHDQHIDIIFTASRGNFLGLFFGNGRGSFENLTTVMLSKDSSPHTVAVGDLNHDSNIDLVIGKYGIANIGILLGQGDGNFENETLYMTESIISPEIVALADLNKDTHIDIIVVDSLSNNFSIFYGDGTGQYTNGTIYTSNFGLSATSVTIDDVNGDGHLDIVIAYSLSHNIGIFLGYSNQTFFNTEMYPTDVYSPPYSVTIADFNNDHISDIIVANYLIDAIGVFHGFGNGSFTQQILYSTGNKSGPWAMAVHDFNGDQRADLAITFATSNQIALFLGYDFGDMQDQITFDTGSAAQPIAMATADFNHDHWEDLIIANYGTGIISVQFGYEKNRFLHETIITNDDIVLPSSIAVGDFNADGHPDFVTANFGSSSISIVYGNGNGSFSVKTSCSTGVDSQPINLAVGYLNNDQWLDIVVADLINDNIAIFLGYQYIAFTNQQSYPVQVLSHPLALVIGDFNNDRILDVAASTDGQATGCVFLGMGNGTFAAALPFTIDTFRDAQLITAADWNRDGCLDLITVNVFQSLFSVFFGYCNGSFVNVAMYSTGNQSFPTSISTGDFNEDKNIDIVLTTSGSNTITVFFNDGDGHFSNSTVYSTGLDSNPNALVVGDFNHDQHVDIAVTNYHSHSIGVFLGYGNGSFADLLIYSTGANSVPNMINVGDFNEDNLTDLVIVDAQNNRIGVFLNRGNETLFGDAVLYSVNLTNRLSSMSINDFNNDHLLDIAVTSSEAAVIQIYYGNGDGTFGMEMTQSTGAETSPMSILIADLNDDQQKDIVVANYASSDIAVFLGYCCEPFVSPTFLSTGEISNPRSIALGDLNNDQHIDIVVAKSNDDAIGIFLGHGDGTFTNQTNLSTGSGSYPVSIAIADINDDQLVDILVANYYREQIGIFLNSKNDQFLPMIPYPLDLSSRPSSITTHDIDGDQKLDIIVTDDGINSVFLLSTYQNGTFLQRTRFATGYNSGPRSITIGDFNNDTNNEIVVALFGTSRIGLIGRFC